ncbi:hypothetical protein [Microbacterium sp. NPDC056569]|uniref:hypothetical protein n=1 Tax=Microbacterium sp. NPDC056569 TaxID=3345867 RepID=UPI00366A8919
MSQPVRIPPPIEPHFPVPVYRHFATPDRTYYDFAQAGHSGWAQGTVAFWAHPIAEPGTVPVYEHFADGPRRYIYDLRPEAHDSWSAGVAKFHVFAQLAPDSTPIYQHRITPQKKGKYGDRYLYDTNEDGSGGYGPGNVVFFAYPPGRMPLLETIVDVLNDHDTTYHGVTYQLAEHNTVTIVDTPRLWGLGPSAPNPSPGAADLLTTIQNTVVTAQQRLDITLLWNNARSVPTLPSGAFQQAIANGLQMLVASKRSPRVRILVGVPIKISSLTSAVMDWVDATLKMAGLAGRILPFDIVAGYTNLDALTSWNHSKIIAADGVRVLAGGHNLWEEYLGPHPVHDVSLMLDGPAAATAHGFCDTLWSRVGTYGVLHRGTWTKRGTIPPVPNGPGAPAATGSTSVLALGRLGYLTVDTFSITTNASVSARLMAICSAKSSIRMAQQTLYFEQLGVGWFDFYTMWALLRAMEAGVQVQIVVSNDGGVYGYDGNAQTVADIFASLAVLSKMPDLYRPPLDPVREDYATWAAAGLTAPQYRLPLPVSRIPTANECSPVIAEMNRMLSIAPLYYGPDRNAWSDGTKASNHSKVWIIDDEYYYVGSDNAYLSMYPAGLMEYGHLVEGSTETAKFAAEYWDKLWGFSKSHLVRPAEVRFSVL